MHFRKRLDVVEEITQLSIRNNYRSPFERWKYTELILLQKEIGNDDTAKQRPIQLMDCTANTWNAAGIKKLDGRK
jgi:hypothetical protein